MEHEIIEISRLQCKPENVRIYLRFRSPPGLVAPGIVTSRLKRALG